MLHISLKISPIRHSCLAIYPNNEVLRDCKAICVDNILQYLLPLFILCLYTLYIFLSIQNLFLHYCAKYYFQKEGNLLKPFSFLMMMHALNVYENIPRKNMEHKRFRFSYYNGVVIIATNLSFSFLEHLNLEMFSNI